MTEILILLWLADVCRASRELLGLCAVIGLIVYLVMWVFSAAEMTAKPQKWHAWTLVGVFVLAAILPSERTLHVAAAARAAHLASETELGELATDVIKQVLQRLKSELKEGSK